MVERQGSLFEQALAVVLAHEGGLSEDPADPGGTTAYGISLRYLRSLGVALGDLDRDRDVDADDVRQLTKEQAASLYRQWWDRYGYARLPDPLAIKVFDLAVNMGAPAAHRLLQQALRACGEPVVVDGIIGPKTVRAAQRVDTDACLRELRAAAVLHYLSLVERNAQLKRFLRGWIRRAVY